MGLCYASYSIPQFPAQSTFRDFLYQYIHIFLMTAWYIYALIDLFFYLQISGLLPIFTTAFHALLNVSHPFCMNAFLQSRYLEITLVDQSEFTFYICIDTAKLPFKKTAVVYNSHSTKDYPFLILFLEHSVIIYFNIYHYDRQNMAFHWYFMAILVCMSLLMKLSIFIYTYIKCYISLLHIWNN